MYYNDNQLLLPLNFVLCPCRQAGFSVLLSLDFDLSTFFFEAGVLHTSKLDVKTHQNDFIDFLLFPLNFILVPCPLGTVKPLNCSRYITPSA